ncbi:CD225/dispanin family protein [Luteimonas panaciterrae]|uniref:CD225/dispanin family protein n=1 Tax=Luteimonas panaciterrae TaxID=363885 RepID=UPI001CFA98A1|nr:CD225/dispanin family protein [Luteimonas panaciterrae]
MSSLPPSPPPAPGQSFGAAAPLPPGSVPNYLAWSIISTVLGACLCCPLGLLGIVAIVFSSKVNGLLAQGNLEAAQRASKNAKTWCWVATALAIIGLLINVYFYATGGPAAYQEWMRQMQSMQQ